MWRFAAALRPQLWHGLMVPLKLKAATPVPGLQHTGTTIGPAVTLECMLGTQRCSPRQRRACAGRAAPYTPRPHAWRSRADLPAAQVVVEGDPGDFFYIILDGEAVVYQNTLQGPRKVNHLFRSDFFGERALLEDAPRWVEGCWRLGGEAACVCVCM